jgi:peptide-methionine (R)-S-oxide reductase
MRKIRMSRRTTAILIPLVLAACTPPASEAPPAPPAAPPPAAAEPEHGVRNPLGLSEAEWKKKLSPEQYYICRQQGTERPFTGKWASFKGEGTFACAACGQDLFDAKAKFESGTGWPSFWQPLKKEAVRELKDASHGMVRVEIRCSRCDSHLGHVFDDGPQPTGLRYCMNSAALDLKDAGKR